MKAYYKALELAQKNKKVLVTGPQRSGTTFVSHCFSVDLGVDHIDEDDYTIDNLDLLADKILDKDSYVIHGPGVFHKVKDILEICADIFIVVMLRNTDEIIQSQTRINWNENEAKERTGMQDSRPYSTVQYERWNETKKSLDPEQYLEIPYLSMKNHALWIEQRKNFSPRQWNS